MRILNGLLLCLSVIAGQVMADTFSSDRELKGFANSVMEKAGSGDTVGALNSMAPYTIIPEAEFQSAVLNSKAQRDQFGLRYGKSTGYEFISEERIGDSLVRLVYIEKTEKHALPWVFYFYKSTDGWVLNSFQWHDQLPMLFSN